MLSAHWLKFSPVDRQSLRGPAKWVQKILDAWEDGFLKLRDTYKAIITWALKRPKKLVALAILSLFINLVLVRFLGTEFQPQYDSGEFMVSIQAPAGTSLERMQELATPVEQEVLKIPGLETAFMVLGSQRNPVYIGSIGVRLVPSDQRSTSMMDIMDDLRVKFRKFKGLKIAVNNSQGVGRGDSRPVQIGLRGPDLEELTRLGSELADNIRKIPGTADVDISSSQDEPEVQIRLGPYPHGSGGS